jgi:protein SCO1/2
MSGFIPCHRLGTAESIVLAATLILGGCSDVSSRAADELRGTILANPLPRPDFTLTTTRGEPFDFRRETGGRLTLLFFGYTSCPDICPMHMAHIAAVLRKLTPDMARRIGVVMVTVDPERDTPEEFRRWLDTFDPSFIGLTGSAEALVAAQQALHMPPAVKQGEGPDYLMGHAAYVVAFTPDDSAHVIYPSGTRQSDWAHDLPLLLSGDWNEP